MNARQQLKPKTIRLAILLALAGGAITTIDDLQTKIDEPRKKVAGAVYPAAVEGLIKRMRDDVTGAPAYQITANGREYLAKYSGEVAEPSLPETPVCAESQTATITPCVKTDILDRNEPTVSAIIGAMALGYQGGNEPSDGHWLTQFHRQGMRDAQLDRITLMLRNSSAEALASNDSVEILLANILHKAAQQHSPAGYVTQRPGKPLTRFTKAESAQARAMSSARAGKRAQVFALVPVGVAVPGAEWKAA